MRCCLTFYILCRIRIKHMHGNCKLEKMMFPKMPMQCFCNH